MKIGLQTTFNTEAQRPQGAKQREDTTFFLIVLAMFSLYRSLFISLFLCVALCAFCASLR
jgi:hypothetical protein